MVMMCPVSVQDDAQNEYGYSQRSCRRTTEHQKDALRFFGFADSQDFCVLIQASKINIIYIIKV